MDEKAQMDIPRGTWEVLLKACADKGIRPEPGESEVMFLTKVLQLGCKAISGGNAR